MAPTFYCALRAVKAWVYLPQIGQTLAVEPDGATNSPFDTDPAGPAWKPSHITLHLVFKTCFKTSLFSVDVSCSYQTSKVFVTDIFNSPLVYFRKLGRNQLWIWRGKHDKLSKRYLIALALIFSKNGDRLFVWFFLRPLQCFLGLVNPFQQGSC